MNESPFRRAWLIFRRRYLIFLIGFLSGCLGYAAARYTVLNANIIGSSMEPALYDGECTAGIRVHDWMDIGRGDIISFHPPFEEDGTLYVKRIIGLPGETVIIKDGKIYIDGSDTPLSEPYLSDGWTVHAGPYEFHVPEGEYLVLGDNRNESYDSRDWKYPYVNRVFITAKSYYVYRPLNRIRYLY